MPFTSRISSSADISGMVVLLVLLGGDSGEKMSKSYSDRSMSPKISSLPLLKLTYEGRR